MQQNINSTYIAGQNPNFEAYKNAQVSSGANKLEDNTLLKQAEKSKDNPAVLVGGTVGFGAFLLWITGRLNEQLRGDYDKTFFGKMEKWGNELGGKPIVANTGKKAAGLGSWIKTNVIDKSEILRSIWNKPSMGGPQVQSQAAGTLGHVSNSAREYMEFYDKKYGTELFKDVLEKTAKEPHKYADELVNAIKAHPEAKDIVMKKPCWWLPKFAVKGNTLGEIENKIRLTKNYKSWSNPLGAKLSGGTFRSLEALSNGMAAGKVAVLLQAFFLAQSLKEGMDAPKGDKVKTFMESIASFMAMMLTMGIQLKAFNAVAGMKFIGMKPEDYKKYHDLIDRINAAAKNGDKATHTALKAELKNLKKAGNVKFWQKPFKWAGNILSWGRIKETIRPVTEVNNATGFFNRLGKNIKNGLKMTPYGAKVGASYAGRFALIATVVMSIFTDTGVKISHAIFGRPKKSILDKEETKEEPADKSKMAQSAQQKLQEQEQLLKQVQEAQKAVNNPHAVNPNVKYKEGNLLTQMKANQGHLNAPMGAQTLGGQPLGAQNINSTEQPEVKRTYVPNPILGPEDEISPAESRTARIDAVMKQADRAELQAQKFLNGNSGI